MVETNTNTTITKERPLGVTILAVLYFLSGLLNLVSLNVAIMILGLILIGLGYLLWVGNNLGRIIVMVLSGIGAAIGILLFILAIVAISFVSSLMGLATMGSTMGPSTGMSAAPATAAMGGGLLAGIFAFVVIILLIYIAINIYIIIYLMKPHVKEYFGA